MFFLFQIRLPNGRQLRKKLDKDTTLGQLWKEVVDEAGDQINGYSGFMQVWLQLFPHGGVAWTQKLKIPSDENPELSKTPSFKPGVGQNTASCAFPTARNFDSQISSFLVHSTSMFFCSSLQT